MSGGQTSSEKLLAHANVSHEILLPLHGAGRRVFARGLLVRGPQELRGNTTLWNGIGKRIRRLADLLCHRLIDTLLLLTWQIIREKHK